MKFPETVLNKYIQTFIVSNINSHKPNLCKSKQYDKSDGLNKKKLL